ncbi:MAG: phosphate transport system protein [Clostridiales bacterium]|jgi:phosphate transport system protein|nr:phosphate transport system protein [Clostridiales bacterium]
MRVALDNDLNAIHVDIIKMGTLLERTIDETISALVYHNVELAQSIVDGDDRFDEMETIIENKCVSIIARQQPVASDLRKLFTVIKIVTDLERIADHCQDISKLTVKIAGKEYVKPLVDLSNMAKQVKEMVKMTVDCYIDQDVRKGRLICSNDDIVDKYLEIIRNDLERIILEKPEFVGQCVDLLMIAKYFERMADHATNVAEWIIFSVEGKRHDEA